MKSLSPFITPFSNLVFAEVLFFYKKYISILSICILSTICTSLNCLANDADRVKGLHFSDQPDKNSDFQIYFIYLVDVKGDDNRWDINGKMEAEILKMNKKLWKLTGEK